MTTGESYTFENTWYIDASTTSSSTNDATYTFTSPNDRYTFQVLFGGGQRSGRTNRAIPRVEDLVQYIDRLAGVHRVMDHDFDFEEWLEE